MTPPPPLAMILIHVACLAGVVVFAHHPAVFMGLFLFFLSVAHAYQHYQDRLSLREGLLAGGLLRRWSGGLGRSTAMVVAAGVDGDEQRYGEGSELVIECAANG